MIVKNMRYAIRLFLAFLISWIGFGGCITKLPSREEQILLGVNACTTRRPLNSYQEPRHLRVYVSEDFNSTQRIWIEKGFRKLASLDFTFQIVETQSNANLYIRRRARDNFLVGFYEPNSNNILIDADRNSYEITGAVIHEFEHWLGMTHVCQQPGELDVYNVPVLCSPVGYGTAAINPRVSDTRPTELTDLDRAELARTRNCQALLSIF